MIGHGSVTANRRQIDDRAGAFLPAHLSLCGLCAQKHRPRIDRVDCVPETRIDVINRLERVDASVIDPDIQATETFDRGVRQPLNVTRTTDIGGVKVHGETGLDQFAAALRRQTADQYIGPCFGQAPTDGEADAVAAAGDNGGFSGQIQQFGKGPIRQCLVRIRHV
ncbi:hypothetical protein D3C85_933810 [compost metagenome]